MNRLSVHSDPGVHLDGASPSRNEVSATNTTNREYRMVYSSLRKRLRIYHTKHYKHCTELKLAFVYRMPHWSMLWISTWNRFEMTRNRLVSKIWSHPMISSVAVVSRNPEPVDRNHRREASAKYAYPPVENHVWFTRTNSRGYVSRLIFWRMHLCLHGIWWLATPLMHDVKHLR